MKEKLKNGEMDDKMIEFDSQAQSSLVCRYLVRLVWMIWE